MSFNLCRVFMESFTPDVSWEVLLNSSSKSRGAGERGTVQSSSSSFFPHCPNTPWTKASVPPSSAWNHYSYTFWVVLPGTMVCCSTCSKAFYSSSANYERISAVIYLQHLNEIRASTVTTTWWCLGLIGSALALSFSQILQNFFFEKVKEERYRKYVKKWSMHKEVKVDL